MKVFLILILFGVVVINSQDVEEAFDCKKEIIKLKEILFNVKMGPMGIPGKPGKCECDITKILSRINVNNQTISQKPNPFYGLDFELRLKNLERDLRVFIKRSMKNSKK